MRYYGTNRDLYSISGYKSLDSPLFFVIEINSKKTVRREGNMAKKIAVLVRDRQDEALRMAVGLTLADDEVNVFVMDRKLESNEGNDLNVETLGDMDAKLFTNHPENKFEKMTTEQIAKALTGYDVIIPY
jgi:hypothetical protein